MKRSKKGENINFSVQRSGLSKKIDHISTPKFGESPRSA